MKISVILAHPDLKSINHAIAKKAVEALKGNGHKVIFHDLYKEKFDPLLPAKEIVEDARLPANIKKHCEEIATVDGIVIVHPTHKQREKRKFSAIRWKPSGETASSASAVLLIFIAGFLI